MSNVLKEYFTGIADSIREKTNSDELISVQDFSNKIRGIDLGIFMPEFISADLDEEYNLTWEIMNNYMLDRYQHNTYFKITINEYEFIQTETSLNIANYVTPGKENIVRISIIADIYDNKQYEIKVEVNENE